MSDRPEQDGGPPLQEQSGGPPPRRIFVGKTPPNMRNEELEDLFSKYGKVVSAIVKPKGFAFVEMEDERDAEDAIRALDGSDYQGAAIAVDWARGRERGGGDRGGGRGGPGGGCFTCGSSDHWARECPRGGGDACFNCGEPGHFARECRMERRGGRPGRGGPPPRNRYDPYGGRGGGGYDRYRRSRSRSPYYRRSRSPPRHRDDRYRDDRYRDDRYRDDRYRDDRYRDDRYRDDGPRGGSPPRQRSRSPPRYRSRSPPRGREGGYDGYGGGQGGDHQGPPPQHAGGPPPTH